MCLASEDDDMGVCGDASEKALLAAGIEELLVNQSIRKRRSNPTFLLNL